MNLNVNYKKSKLKISASALAIATTLGMFGDAMGMDDPKPGEIRDLDGKIEYWNANTRNWGDNCPDNAVLQQNKHFMIEDNTANSISMCIGDPKCNSFEKRLLSLDGGGLRGLFSILELTVLEQILNHPVNAIFKHNLIEKIQQTAPEDYLKRFKAANGVVDAMALYVRDLFDVGAGTSTGSIMISGLFSKKNYSAVDVAKIYTRYGYKIFDENKDGTGKVSSRYSDKGLNDLLEIHFGDDTIQNGVHKPIFIAVQNETTGNGELFSTYDAETLSIHNAAKASSSAPTYFPAHIITRNGKKIQYSDGGTFHNNPAYIALIEYMGKTQTKERKEHYAIFSFGTGAVPRTENDIRAVNAGEIRSVGCLLPDMMGARSNGDFELCKKFVTIEGSDVDFLARINPLLEIGKGDMDNTSPEYIRYAIYKAFQVTKESAFKIMCEKLGLVVPDMDGLEKIHKDVLCQIDHLSSNDYSQIMPLEKEYILRKVMEKDFTFFENAKSGFKSKIEVEKFIRDLVGDLAKKKEAEGYFAGLYGTIFGDIAAMATEYLLRGLEFHELSNDVSKVSPLTGNQLDDLKNFTNVGLTYNSYNNEKNPKAVTLLNKIYTQFIVCADDAVHDQFKKFDGYKAWSKKNTIGKSGVYATHDSPCLDFICDIFWKDILRNIEHTVTKEQLMDLYNSLGHVVANEIISHKKTFLGNSAFVGYLFHATRATNLKNTLWKYISKKFPA